jgi:hypothetical protein
MHRSTKPTMIALVLCLALVVAPVAAFGAASTSTPSPVPAAVGAGGPATAVEVQMWPSEADGSSLIVSAEIPADAKLPYTLRLPMPKGINVTWCGEILGGTAEQDKEAAYTLEDGQGGKALVMTLTQARIGQYEGTLSSPTQVGGRNETVLEWIQSAPAGEEHFAVKFANTAGDPKVDPAAEGAPQQNETGERLYSLATQKLSIGQTLKLAVSWTTVAAGSQVSQTATTASGSYDIVLIVLVAALVAAVVALVFVVGRTRNGGSDDESAPPTGRGRRADGAPDAAEEPVAELPESDDPFSDLD